MGGVGLGGTSLNGIGDRKGDVERVVLWKEGKDGWNHGLSHTD